MAVVIGLGIDRGLAGPLTRSRSGECVDTAKRRFRRLDPMQPARLGVLGCGACVMMAGV